MGPPATKWKRRKVTVPAVLALEPLEPATESTPVALRPLELRADTAPGRALVVRKGEQVAPPPLPPIDKKLSLSAAERAPLHLYLPYQLGTIFLVWWRLECYPVGLAMGGVDRLGEW